MLTQYQNTKDKKTQNKGDWLMNTVLRSSNSSRADAQTRRGLPLSANSFIVASLNKWFAELIFYSMCEKFKQKKYFVS